MKPPSTRTTLIYHLERFGASLRLLWWDVLDVMEGLWERHVCAADPYDAWLDAEYQRKLVQDYYQGSTITHTPGRDADEISHNLLADPRSLARKEMLS